MTFLEWVTQEHPEALLADGLDAALIGGLEEAGTFRLVYSVPQIIEILMARDGMTQDEAWEFADFNIWPAWVGPGTPIYWPGEKSD